MKMKQDPDHLNMTCAMGHVWPPAHAKAYGPDPENIRDIVEPPQYARMRAWFTNCGLLQMECSPGEKCLSCKNLLVDGELKIKVASRIPASPAQRSRDLRFSKNR